MGNPGGLVLTTFLNAPITKKPVILIFGPPIKEMRHPLTKVIFNKLHHVFIYQYSIMFF